MNIDKLRAERQRKYNQYAKAKQELHEADLALDLANDIQALEQNDVLTFLWGRGEQRQEYTGTVLGSEQTSKGLRIRVFVGSGVNADIKTIQPRDVTAVIAEKQENTNEH